MDIHCKVWVWLFSVVNCCYLCNTVHASKEKWPEIDDWNKTITFDEPYQLNQARLTVKSTINVTVQHLWQFEECYGCPLKKLADVPADGNYTYLTPTFYGSDIGHSFSIVDNSGSEICRDLKHLLERGEYWLIVFWQEDGSTLACDLVLFNDPPNYYLPILWTFFGLVGLAVIWILLKLCYRKGVFEKCKMKSESHNLEPVSVSKLELTQNGSLPSVTDSNMNIEAKQQPAAPQPKVKQRLRSLDTLRGLSLIVMIFVNYGGGQYYFFKHTLWNGLYVADLVFPWFMWIMGTSMVFSFKGLRKRQTPNSAILYKIVKRTFWLFVIGIFLGGNSVDPNYLRIPGVLQYFSITYFVLAMTHFLLGNKNLEDKLVAYSFRAYIRLSVLPSTLGVYAQDSCVAVSWIKGNWWSPIRDVILYWGEWLVMSCILALHLGLTFGLAEPGCPKGYLGPGGMHEGGKHYNCTAGAAGYIDRQFFGEDHIYRWNAIKDVYDSPQNHDPEGILGSLTSIIMCFFGLQAGKIIAAYQNHSSRLIRWIIWAIITGGIGVALCQGKLNDGWIPINKNLWSVSFILILSGMAFILLSVLYITIDLVGFWSGAPFFYPGMNSIVVYMCHSIFASYFPISWILAKPTVHWTQLLVDVWGTSIWIVVAYIMYRKNVFIAL